jgi:glycosyltransferase involved in cell wall biosynthesis
MEGGAEAMRVLILNQYALPAGSAGITRHGDIGAELVRRGHEVTVIASDFDYLRRQPAHREEQSEVTPDGVRFVWLRTGAYSGNDGGRVKSILRYTVRAAWSAMRLRPRPDVIIGSSPHPLAGLSAGVAARLLGVPWIYEARDIWPSALVELGALKRGGMTHRALELVERYSYRASARVVVVPPRGSLRLAELGFPEAKAIHIPNGADLSAIAGPLPPTLEKVLAGQRGRFVIAYTGAMGVPHDLESCLDGLALLAADDPEVANGLALVLVGDGVRRAGLMQRARELNLANVHFHDAIDKAAVRTAIARADACLLQVGSAAVHTKFGLSPNKLFDYFAAGKPVLISSAHPTIVDEADAGFRFQPGDPQAFADVVKRLINTPAGERQAMGERGRELVRTEYTIKAVTDAYERLLFEVTGTRPHAGRADQVISG